MATGGLIEELWRCQQGMLVGYLTRMLQSPELAQEVAQESFAAMHMASRANPIRFARSFLYKTATNFARMRLRRLRLERRYILEAVDGAMQQVADDVPQPEQVALSDEVIRQVNSAVDALNPRQQAAFIMAYVEEKPRQEIANLLGISQKRLDKTITKALKCCRKHLHELESRVTPPRIQSPSYPSKDSWADACCLKGYPRSAPNSGAQALPEKPH